MRIALIALAVGLLTGCPPSAPSFKPKKAPMSKATPGSVGVAIVLDTSGSMSGEKLDSVKKITEGKIASKLDLFSLNNGLDVAIVECGGDDARVVLGMGAYEPELFKQALGGLRSHGTTPLRRSLELAVAQLKKTRAETQHLFLLSDGAGDESIDAVVASLPANGLKGANVHVIGFKTNVKNYAPFKKLGGSILMAKDAEALDEQMTKTFKVILKLEAD